MGTHRQSTLLRETVRRERKPGQADLKQSMTEFELQYGSHLREMKRIVRESGLSDGEKSLIDSHLQGSDTIVRDEFQKLVKVATHDPLTGLLNWRGLVDESRQHFTDPKRLNDPSHWKHIVFGMADIHKLKFVNDTFGHEVGNELIVAVANALGKTFRKADMPTRYGGDEFCFILTARFERAFSIAMKAKVATDEAAFEISKKYGWNRDEANKRAGRVDFGLADITRRGDVPSSPDDADQILQIWIKEADAAMYRQKQSLECKEKDGVTVASFRFNGRTLEPMEPAYQTQ